MTGAGLIGTLLCAAAAAAAPPSPWNTDALFMPPAWSRSERAPAPYVRSITYEGIPIDGASTSVFAYYGTPGGSPPPEGWPAVVCVHGGGGTAFAEWVRHWNRRGYAAIAMTGTGPIRNGMPKDGMNGFRFRTADRSSTASSATGNAP